MTGSGDDWSKLLTKRLLAAELNAGRTPTQIAARAGCSENTVRNYLARHGLVRGPEAPASAAADYGRLGSIASVAELHGVSFATARRWLLGLGIQLKEAHRPTSADIDVQQASRRYERGESLAGIAADLGVGVNTLKRRLEAAGVVMRPRGRPARMGDN